MTLRLRERGDVDAVAGQVLIYPGTDGGSWEHPSRREFDGVVLTRASMDQSWERYSGGRDLSRDQFACPLQAREPRRISRPRSSSSAAATCCATRAARTRARLAEAGVPVDEVCYPGQPHGFVNFGVPAAEEAYARTGTWLRELFARAEVTA